MSSLQRFLVLASVLGALSAAGVGAWARYVPAPGPLAGIRIDGVVLGANLRGLVEERVAALQGRRVRLVPPLGGPGFEPVEKTLGELGVEVDIDAVVRRVEGLGANADPWTRAELALAASRGQLDVPLLATVNASRVAAWLEPLKETADEAPVAARLDLEHRMVVPETNGRYLDTNGVVAALEALVWTRANDGVADLVVPVLAFPPRISSSYLAKLDVSHVVGSYETTFSRGGEQARRARNVEVASSRINGVVVGPGEALSFNEVVGARSEENGFKRAGEIFRGEMVEGVGGGTCQVASTLHAAAFFGGLDVIERLPHSRPSGYISMGLDATVVYPSVDLKLRNPYAFGVVIHAFVDKSGQRLKVELLGPAKPVEVSFTHTVIGGFPYNRKVVEDEAVSKATLKQRGIRGVQIRRVRTLVFTDGKRRQETSIDLYPPTQEIYRVPPGFDPLELPELPAL